MYRERGTGQDRQKYDTSVRITNEEVRAQKPKNGVDKVVVPGDRNLEKKLNISDDTDIEIDEKYKEILKNLAS